MSISGAPTGLWNIELNFLAPFKDSSPDVFGARCCIFSVDSVTIAIHSLIGDDTEAARR